MSHAANNDLVQPPESALPRRKKARKPRARSGGEKLYSKGKTLIWVPVDARQKKMIRTAAANCGKPMSQFMLECGLRQAREIVENIGIFKE